MTQHDQGRHDGWRHRLARIGTNLIFSLLLPAAVLAGGWFGYQWLMDTAPKAERKGGRRAAQARLVEVRPVQKQDRQVVVHAMGTVKPARQVMLRPQVGGRVVETHSNLEAGGRLPAGAVALRIEPIDYELDVALREADVAEAESNLAIEMGQQKIARKEFELLGEAVPRDASALALREPQLAQARARLAAAKTALESARLDLERTTIEAPFNALVQAEDIEIGSIVGSQSVVAELVGTDRYWIELSVPVDELRWIELPRGALEVGSTVRVHDTAAWGEEPFREARIIRFTANVDERSRMTRVIAAVDDPLAVTAQNADEPPLLLNSYVRGDIQGRMIEGVVPIAREHLHENDTVWVMNAEDRLETRRVDVVWRGLDEVYVASGLDDGELLITSNLSTAVDGMAVRIDGERIVNVKSAKAAPAAEHSQSVEEARLSRPEPPPPSANEPTEESG